MALVVVCEDDLLFASRIERGLSAGGYRAQFVTDVPAFWRALYQAPTLVMVNIGARSIPWEHMVDLAKNESKWRQVPVLGYGPHVDLELRQRALAAGCDVVVGRSAVDGNLAALVARWGWRADDSRCAEPLPPGMIEGLAQFNRREFFECHETIEVEWMREAHDVRLLYQGILQVGVACYHIQQRNWRGAMKMIARALPKLYCFAPACMGIDVAGLIEATEAMQERLRQLGPERIAVFDPRVYPRVVVGAHSN